MISLAAKKFLFSLYVLSKKCLKCKRKWDKLQNHPKFWSLPTLLIRKTRFQSQIPWGLWVGDYGSFVIVVPDFTNLFVPVITSTVSISSPVNFPQSFFYFPLFLQAIAMHFPDWTLSAEGASTAQETLPQRLLGLHGRNRDRLAEAERQKSGHSIYERQFHAGNYWLTCKR